MVYESDLRECQMARHRIAIEGCLDNRRRPIGFVGLQAGRCFTIEFHEVEFVVIDRGIELVDCLFQLRGVKTEFRCQLTNRVGFLGRLVGGVID